MYVSNASMATQNASLVTFNFCNPFLKAFPQEPAFTLNFVLLFQGSTSGRSVEFRFES
jgi:hypothetical protein